MKPDCVIPAAGTSSRMGRWKLVLPYRGSTIIEKSIDAALEECGRVIVVTGHRAEELETFLGRYSPPSGIGERFREVSKTRESGPVITVRHPDYEQGMFSSIQKGAALVQSPLFFIALGDMPAVPAEVYRQLLTCMRSDPETEIVRPVYRGRPGHPVLLRKTCTKTILETAASGAMAMVLKRHTVKELEVSSPGAVIDFDTPEAYQDQEQ